MADLTKAAAALRDVRLRRERFPGFSTADVPKDESEGYAIQDALAELLAADLGGIVGYKIGCTSPALQQFMNIECPCSGTMFAATEVERGKELRLENYVKPAVECEIGVRLGEDLDPRDGAIDRSRAAAAIAVVFVSIEIVDERFVDYRRVGTPTLIADNFMNAGFVRGKERRNVDPLQLDRAHGETLVNGELYGEGYGRDVLGHPLDVLIWLANESASRGRPLLEGTIITTGSMVPPYYVQPGDVVTMRNDMLGEATVIVR
jgi:2-oxo-3-hexenedioate decarboxylase/2-keto-4-pentenoate hydratase